MTDDARPVDPGRLRAGMGAWVTGVAVVTTRSPDGRDGGLTLTSLSLISHQPPLVAWSLDRGSSSFADHHAAEHFAVHVLAADQEDLCRRFAQKGGDKLAGLRTERGAGGVPLLDGVTARIECRTWARYDGGDHVIVVGEAVAVRDAGTQPLTLARGRLAPGPRPQEET